MTTIPTWVLWVTGGILPLTGLVVGLVTVEVNRATGRREHSLDLLKWAGERAVEPGNAKANSMGTETLRAPRKGHQFSASDRRLVWAIGGAVLAPTASE